MEKFVFIIALPITNALPNIHAVEVAQQPSVFPPLVSVQHQVVNQMQTALQDNVVAAENAAQNVIKMQIVHHRDRFVNKVLASKKYQVVVRVTLTVKPEKAVKMLFA